MTPALRPWARRLGVLWWVVRALRDELWGFRVRYPVEPVTAAADKDSLHYHIYSQQLFFDAMELDGHGVPVQHGRRFGRAYNPAYVAWYGLTRLERSVRGQDPPGRDAFLTQVEWLVSHAVRRPDGGVVWHYPFDWIEGAGVLRAPWISAMSQGLAMSALVRAHRLTGDPRLRDLARGACMVFEQGIDTGGVRVIEDGGVLYEEYPCIPPARVLDGFLFSLLGLYDVFVETDDRAVFQLFADGINGLLRTLPSWNYEDRWSWYGTRRWLCPPAYHALNRALLISLAQLVDDPTLVRYAQAWDPRRLTLPDRARVFAMFVYTKNRARLTQHLSARRLPAKAGAASR